jgi:hypothetical protein
MASELPPLSLLPPPHALVKNIVSCDIFTYFISSLTVKRKEIDAEAE